MLDLTLIITDAKGSSITISVSVPEPRIMNWNKNDFSASGSIIGFRYDNFSAYEARIIIYMEAYTDAVVELITTSTDRFSYVVEKTGITSDTYNAASELGGSLNYSDFILRHTSVYYNLQDLTDPFMATVEGEYQTASDNSLFSGGSLAGSEGGWLIWKRNYQGDGAAYGIIFNWALKFVRRNNYYWETISICHF